jgi:adenylate cyclase
MTGDDRRGRRGCSEDPSDGLTTADLRALVESARALSAELELSGLLDRILERATRLTDSPSASVLLFDPLRNRLYFAAARGPTAPAVLDRWGIDSDQGVPVVGSKAGDVFSTGQPLVLESVAGDTDHFKQVDIDVHHTTNSMVCVPVSAAGRPLGVMQLLNKRTGRYAGRDLTLLEHFSAQAAVAIRNVQLFEDLIAHMGLYGSHSRGVGPAELLAELNAPPRFEEVTILFADMRGFTRLSQVMDRPEQTFEYLNEFLRLLATAVLKHEGLVSKFLGDGLMALFRRPGHGEHAVACAFEIVEAFHGLRAAWNDASNTPLDFLDVGIGISTDFVLLGSVGTERVRDFTAIRGSVMLAARLTDHAREGQQVVVDKRTFRSAQGLITQYDGPWIMEIRSLGQLAGRPFEAYSIRSSRSDAGAAPATPPSEVECSPDVFISYSHRDTPWLERLRTHLKPYMRNVAMSVWDDTLIEPGQEWRTEIERVLAGAKVAVLLVTPNFLESDFIAESELPPLLEAASQEGLKILWIPVSASSFDQTAISQYQALSDPRTPLDTHSDAETNGRLVIIARKIADVLGATRPRARPQEANSNDA